MKNLSATQAWDFLQNHADAVLIDVRTPPEWASVGFPDLSSIGKEALAITWTMEEAEAFDPILLDAVKNKEIPLLFICRSGQRSLRAAMQAENCGYQNVINITDGFEDRHGPATGWRASGLPFIVRPL
ncbi:rhodanese-like domain-containing protein [Aristophania vespae]|nr:rhodanese-like domain-containing protein [Aristophania vespae]UMM64408.1 hypothetical protein DM15PD_14220 [Aristophania vespae]